MDDFLRRLLGGGGSPLAPGTTAAPAGMQTRYNAGLPLTPNFGGAALNPYSIGAMGPTGAPGAMPGMANSMMDIPGAPQQQEGMSNMEKAALLSQAIGQVAGVYGGWQQGKREDEDRKRRQSGEQATARMLGPVLENVLRGAARRSGE